MNLNKVYLIGRLAQEPETRTTPSGDMVCTFGLATNRIWIDKTTKERQEKTEFHNIVLWRRLAEIASQYLKKGSLVLVEGRIQTRTWVDQTGNKRYRTEIIAENIQLGPKMAGSQDIEERSERQGNLPSQDDIPVVEEKTVGPEDLKTDNEEEEIDIKDIPF